MENEIQAMHHAVETRRNLGQEKQFLHFFLSYLLTETKQRFILSFLSKEELPLPLPYLTWIALMQ